MQAGVGLPATNVMPIFMIIALDIVIIICVSINCSAVISSPTVIISILREASSATYGPRVYFPSYKFPIYNFSFLFTFILFLHSSNLLYLSLSDLTFAIDREGIDNPFIALGASV